MYIFSIQNHSLFLAYLPTYLPTYVWTEKCWTDDGSPCKFPFKAADRSINYGCFWNPLQHSYACPISLSQNLSILKISSCAEPCSVECAKNNWKCDDSCIPLRHQCHGQCFECKLNSLRLSCWSGWTKTYVSISLLEKISFGVYYSTQIYQTI